MSEVGNEAFTILVVDDHVVQVKTLEQIFTARKIGVKTATNAPEALKLLEKESVDLILSDIIMPGMNGFEFCRKLKADTKTKNLPVILLSAINNPWLILEGLECGIDSFMVKPFRPKNLIAHVKEIIQEKKKAVAANKKIPPRLSFLGKTRTIPTETDKIMDFLVSALDEFDQVRNKLGSRAFRDTRPPINHPEQSQAIESSESCT